LPRFSIGAWLFDGRSLISHCIEISHFDDAAPSEMSDDAMGDTLARRRATPRHAAITDAYAPAILCFRRLYYAISRKAISATRTVTLTTVRYAQVFARATFAGRDIDIRLIRLIMS
jgi:hypothetical protein